MADRSLTPKQKLKMAAIAAKEHREKDERARTENFELVCERYREHLNCNADVIDAELQGYIKEGRFHVQVIRSDLLRIPDNMEEVIARFRLRKGDIYTRVLQTWIRSRYEGVVDFHKPFRDPFGDAPELVLKTDGTNGAR